MKIQKITGKDVAKAFRALPDHLKIDLQAEMDTTAFQISQGAKALVPVRTGRLQRAIGWKSRPRSLSAVAGIDVKAAPHWVFVEKGTVKQDAKPFMRPAAEALAGEHAARLGRAMTKAQDKLEREANQ